MKKLYTFTVVSLLITLSSNAQTYHLLSGGAFTQNWSNTSLITTNDNWSNVPSIIGYLGDDGSTTVAPVNPQTALLGSYSVTQDVNANQTSPNTFTSGGVTELEITDPVVAFQGSGTADAPNLVIFINSTGVNNIRVRYNLRDIDAAADDAVQPVALQYRIGTTGDFIDIPGAFVADASSGPALATLVTPIDVILPAACNNQAQLQIRIITGNATGSDELIGVDDINITSDLAAAVRDLIRDPNYVRIAGNPSNEITIQFNKAAGADVQLQFTAANGQMVLQRRIARVLEGQTEKVSLAHLPKGVYLLSIRSKEGLFTTKVSN